MSSRTMRSEEERRRLRRRHIARQQRRWNALSRRDDDELGVESEDDSPRPPPAGPGRLRTSTAPPLRPDDDIGSESDEESADEAAVVLAPERGDTPPPPPPPPPAVPPPPPAGQQAKPAAGGIEQPIVLPTQALLVEAAPAVTISPGLSDSTPNVAQTSATDTDTPSPSSPQPTETFSTDPSLVTETLSGSAMAQPTGGAQLGDGRAASDSDLAVPSDSRGTAIGVTLGVTVLVAILVAIVCLLIRFRRRGGDIAELPNKFRGYFSSRTSTFSNPSWKLWRGTIATSDRSTMPPPSAAPHAYPGISKKTNTAIIDHMIQAAYDTERGAGHGVADGMRYGNGSWYAEDEKREVSMPPLPPVPALPSWRADREGKEGTMPSRPYGGGTDGVMPFRRQERTTMSDRGIVSLYAATPIRPDAPGQKASAKPGPGSVSTGSRASHVSGLSSVSSSSSDPYYFSTGSVPSWQLPPVTGLSGGGFEVQDRATVRESARTDSTNAVFMAAFPPDFVQMDPPSREEAVYRY